VDRSGDGARNDHFGSFSHGYSILSLVAKAVMERRTRHIEFRGAQPALLCCSDVRIRVSPQTLTMLGVRTVSIPETNLSSCRKSILININAPRVEI
jgi:hypothetical protein